MEKITKLFTLAAFLLLIPSYQIPNVTVDRDPGTDHGEGYFQGAAGTQIFYQYWRVDRPAAVMIIVHGYTGSSDGFGDLVRHLTGAGISVYGLDNRGHGRSGGQRWDTERFSYYVDDLKTYIDMVKEMEPGKKIFMLGHSLGGGITLRYALEYPKDLEGLVVGAPAVGGYIYLPKLGRREISISAARILMPIIGIIARFYDKPIGAYGQMGGMRLGLIVELGKNMVFLQDNAHKLSVPCLFMVGSEDPLVPPEMVKIFYDHVGIEDKILMVYDGFYHGIFNDISQEMEDIVFADLDSWLAPRI